MGNVRDIDNRKYVGKTVMLNYDAILAEPTDSCLFCLTRQQQMALIGLIEPLAWTKRWYSLTDTPIDQDVIDDFYAQLEANLMTDACDLGNQITSMIVMLQELNQMACLQFDQAKAYYRQQLLANGTPGGTPNPSWAYDAGDVTTDQQYARQQALCNAIKRALFTAYQQQLAAGAITLGGLAGVTGIINPVLGMAVGAIGGILLADLYAATQNSTAVDNVACCMYQALDGLVDETSFRTSLDSCGFSFPSDEATLAGAAAACFNDPVLGTGNYRAFQSILGEENGKAVAAGTSAPGDCENCGECADKTWDYTLGQRIWNVFPIGTLVAGTGLKGIKTTNGATGQDVDDFRIEITFPTPCDLTGASTTTVVNGGTPYAGGGSGWTLEIYDHLGGLLVLTPSTAPSGTVSATNALSGSLPDCKTIVLKATQFAGASDLRRPFSFRSFAIDFP